MILFLLKVIRNSAIYPYWIYFNKCWKDNEFLLPYISGNVIEVGCGSGQLKEFVLKNKGANIYHATDYYDPHKSSHYEMNKYEDLSKKYFFNLSKIKEIFVGKSVDYSFIDFPADCRNLEMVQNSTYDTYIASEVFEHVYEIDSVFKEAHRILRDGGNLIFTVPFFYQVHGPLLKNSLDGQFIQDFNRFTAAKIHLDLTSIGFQRVAIFTNVSFFIALTQLINSLFLRKFYQLNKITKALILPILPIAFALVNLSCLLLDAIVGHDENYPGRYNFIYKKL